VCVLSFHFPRATCSFQFSTRCVPCSMFHVQCSVVIFHVQCSKLQYMYMSHMYTYMYFSALGLPLLCSCMKMMCVKGADAIIPVVWSGQRMVRWF
jgi:hypothetical protein